MKETGQNFYSSVKKIIRTFDIFGESFTFRYKDEDKHSTVLGGIICIFFFIIALLYFVYNFIPFYKREIFSLQYYTMNLNNTEQVKLTEAPTALAFGLSDENPDKSLYNISDLVEIKYKYRYTTKIQEENDNQQNINEELEAHRCTKDDFHNLHEKSFDELNINNFYCISRKDLLSPEGIYTDEVFSYYTISVESKHRDNATHNQLINDYLIENDCKLQFYYTDIAINITNLKKPFSSFLNSMFLQLNPTIIQKKNVFFMNYHLLDDNYILRFNQNEEKPEIKTGLSRVEDYSVYKGLDRAERKAESYWEYAKLFIRADNKKVEIKRRYQDLMEFYADTSALLLSIFWFLAKIFAYYDRIKANHSISKKLFYFEGVINNRFEQFKKFKKFINENDIFEKQMHNQLGNKVIIVPQKTQFSNSNDILNNALNSGFKTGDKNFTSNSEIKEKTIKEEDLIDYSTYNIFEMFGSFKFCFCKTKKFQNKVNFIRRANDIIDNKLDIVFYIRNMILFDMINKINLENKTIINFLSRPILYLNEEKEEEERKNDIDLNESTIDSFTNDHNGQQGKKIIGNPQLQNVQYIKGDGFYKTSYKLNPDKLQTKIGELFLKQSSSKTRDKLIYYLKKQLKGV